MNAFSELKMESSGPMSRVAARATSPIYAGQSYAIKSDRDSDGKTSVVVEKHGVVRMKRRIVSIQRIVLNTITYSCSVPQMKDLSSPWFHERPYVTTSRICLGQYMSLQPLQIRKLYACQGQ